MNSNEVIDFLVKHNSWWKWDNHRHLALLTSGKVSDFFANCSPIFTDPRFQDKVGMALSPKYLDIHSKANMWVVGSAMGAIGLAQSIASDRLCRCAYTEHGQMKHLMFLDRFDLGVKPYVILCEDVISTGGTTRQTIKAIKEQHPDVKFHHEILCIINRSGVSMLDRFKIKSIVEVKPNVWEADQIPTKYDKCHAIRPKSHWQAMQEKL